MAKRGDKLVLVCNNAGTPLTVDKRAGNAPPFSEPIPEELFDMVHDHMPASDEAGVTGDAPVRIKVTDFDDAQVVAVCVNHGVCDAFGMGQFMSAWAEAFRGGSGQRDINNDRVSTAIPTPTWGQPPLTKTEGVPAEWQALRHTDKTCPNLKTAPVQSPMYACLKWNAMQCAALKAAALQANTQTGVTFVSTNDAICAEIASAVSQTFEGDPEFKGDASVPLSMIVDHRRVTSEARSPPVFGNVFTSLEIMCHPSPAAAGNVRKALSVGMDKGFITWSLGQGHNMAFKARVLVNSWCPAFKMDHLVFAGPAEDMMLGKPMLAQRAAGMVPQGVNYCIALPVAGGGVKVAGVLAEAAGTALQGKEAGGCSVTMLPFS
jgi:hypothetical protein